VFAIKSGLLTPVSHALRVVWSCCVRNFIAILKHWHSQNRRCDTKPRVLQHTKMVYRPLLHTGLFQPFISFGNDYSRKRL